jgi:outer membrane lipoprotein
MTYDNFHLKLIAGLAVLLLVSSCASPIAKRYRMEAEHGPTFAMVFENPSRYRGQTVIWGGAIIRTEAHKNGAEIFILDLPLSGRDKPETDENPRGRFIAESEAYLDPMIYQVGRHVTVAGKVAGQREVAIGKEKFPYKYPVVAVEQIHLWKKAIPPMYYPYWNEDWGPYWGPGFYWGGFYGDEFEGGEEEEFEHGHESMEQGEHGEER